MARVSNVHLQLSRYIIHNFEFKVKGNAEALQTLYRHYFNLETMETTPRISLYTNYMFVRNSSLFSVKLHLRDGRTDGLSLRSSIGSFVLSLCPLGLSGACIYGGTNLDASYKFKGKIKSGINQ